ncbi:hypothetical protein PC110_g5302 [Phytophthora cactorum]|uniref:Reverse transcriptase domain-containing protein n=1 Tax=Phytophthora cactorum TaxID=29920 RepID=A0A329SNI4_9STRA|nr:hypothetical protein PC110_g5302 [Phytophthora cactorum]
MDEVAGWIEEVTDPTPDQCAVGNDITEVEVLAVIQACKAGKATGSGLLGNDWYRAEFSDTFFESKNYFFCLKKGGDQRKALNYRPIALPNTDYKVFSRILAKRVRATSDERIRPNQNGFVPGRTIHETLHLFEDAQRCIEEDGEQTEAIDPLLKFMKAYGLISRDFLLKTVKRQGYPVQFIRTVGLLHEGTTATFRANGFASRKVSVASGIRQGCPLVPLLFILALDSLYREIERVSSHSVLSRGSWTFA